MKKADRPHPHKTSFFQHETTCLNKITCQGLALLHCGDMNMLQLVNKWQPGICKLLILFFCYSFLRTFLNLVFTLAAISNSSSFSNICIKFSVLTVTTSILLLSTCLIIILHGRNKPIFSSSCMVA